MKPRVLEAGKGARKTTLERLETSLQMTNLEVGEMMVMARPPKGVVWGFQPLKRFSTPEVAQELQSRRSEGPREVQEHGCQGLSDAWA